ncbi:MAG: protein kinase [Chloroflexi bacterium]|nr:protein kinase [Chloroflexota bacterium]
MTLERGASLHNRYRILEILGQGGMGSLYRAIDDNLGVEVAVKENLFTTDEYARQFRSEAIILANLRHPNLPRVSDHFVIDGQGQNLVMDHIAGEDLRERMDHLGIISEADVLIIGSAICDALTYMHTQKPPVLHRDIKPGNVKITPQGQIYLVDFGLAKVVYAGQQTNTGARAMTPGYSPPEQYGAARTDHRSDVYSLGATMYAALVGVIPEDSLARTMEQAELTPIRKRNPKISRRAASAIEKALEVHPGDRFQSAAEFKQAILSAHGITMRKLVEQGAVLPPASMGEITNISFESPSPLSKAVGVPSPPRPLPASTPLDELDFLAPSMPPTRKRPRGCLLTILLVAALLVIGVGAAYVLNPTLPGQIFELWPRSVSGVPVAGDTDSTATPPLVADLIPSVSPTAPPTETLQPSQTPAPSVTPTSTSTPTETPTITLSPSPTLSPTPTPMGGGYGQIAFASDRTGLSQIWLVNVDATGLRRITDSQWGACQPDWSPDGTRLVFISPCDGNRDIYRGASLFIINVDGSNLTPLPTLGGGDFDPVWSPDGSQIAFTSLRNGDRPQVFVIDLKTSEVQCLSEESNRDSQPYWSSDGSQILFVSTRNGPYQIWTMAADGTDQERFTVSRSLKNTYPAWSPDGQVIIFTQSEGEGSITHLIGARYPDGAANEFKVYPFHGAVPMREADYSPDGFWLALESWPDGYEHDIFIMSPNGIESEQLTSDPAWDFDPVWRPINP